MIVRHSADCKDKAKGGDWRKCDCPKALLIYEGEGTGKNRRVSAKTRSWAKAEKAAQEILDSWDPEKVELKQLRAKKEREQVRIEDAIALYIQDQIRNLGDNGTVAMIRSLLGHVNEKGTVVSNGRLFDWLDTLLPGERPTYIAEFSPAHITAWRIVGLRQRSHSRESLAHGQKLFQFCEAQGWVADNPARKLKRLKVKKAAAHPFSQTISTARFLMLWRCTIPTTFQNRPARHGSGAWKPSSNCCAGAAWR